MDKIELKVRFTTEDYLRVFNFLQYSNKRSKFIFNFAKVFFVLFALLTFVIAFFIIRENGFSSSVTVLLSGIAGLILVFGIKQLEKFLNRMSLNKQIESSPLLQEINEILIDETGLSWTNNLSSTKTKWEGFIEATESNDDFFLFSTNKFSQFIPKTAFVDENQQSQFRELVKMKLGDKAKL